MVFRPPRTVNPHPAKRQPGKRLWRPAQLLYLMLTVLGDTSSLILYPLNCHLTKKGILKCLFAQFADHVLENPNPLENSVLRCVGLNVPISPHLCAVASGSSLWPALSLLPHTALKMGRLSLMTSGLSSTPCSCLAANVPGAAWSVPANGQLE